MSPTKELFFCFFKTWVRQAVEDVGLKLIPTEITPNSYGYGLEKRRCMVLLLKLVFRIWRIWRFVSLKLLVVGSPGESYLDYLPMDCFDVWLKEK